MGMRLAIYSHPRPSVRDDFDMGRMYVLVLFDEMGRHNGGEELRRCYKMLLCKYIYSILHRVCCHNHTVVGFGVSSGMQSVGQSQRPNIVRFSICKTLAPTQVLNDHNFVQSLVGSWNILDRK